MSGHFLVETRTTQFVALAIVLVIAASLRIGVVIARPELLAEDRDAYGEIARKLNAGEGYSIGTPPRPTAFRPPLYPLSLAAWFALGGTSASVGWLQVALGVGTVWLTWKLARELQVGGSAALLAALLVGIDPLLLQNTALIMTETLCVFLVTLWLWLWTKRRKPQHRQNWQSGLVIGLLFGLCCLCRPTLLAVGALIILVWLLGSLFDVNSKDGRAAVSSKSALWRTQMLRTLPFLCGVAILLAPWTVRNGLVIGKLTPATSHGGYTLLLANNPVFYDEVVSAGPRSVWQRESLLAWQAGLEQEMEQELADPTNEVARDRWMYARAWRNIRARPDDFAYACSYRWQRFFDILPRGEQSQLPAWQLWCLGGLYGLELLSALIGLSQPNVRRTAWIPCGVLVLGMLFVHTFYWTDLRMRVPVIPVISILAAQGGLAVSKLMCGIAACKALRETPHPQQ